MWFQCFNSAFQFFKIFVPIFQMRQHIFPSGSCYRPYKSVSWSHAAAQVFFKPFWVLLSNQIKKVNRCFVQFWALFVYFWRSFWGLGVSFNKNLLDLLMCTINFSFGSTAISFQFQVSSIWGLFLKLFGPFRAIFQNPRGYLSRSLRIFLEFGLDLRRVLTLTNVEYPFWFWNYSSIFLF